jgi:hypothetical protein
MKRFILVLIAMALACGCAASHKLVWGTVVYESRGDHVLTDLEVIKRIKPDGTEIIHIKVGSSDSKEVQFHAIQSAIDLAGEALKLLPASLLKEFKDRGWVARTIDGEGE